jgi:hypothetical protein
LLAIFTESRISAADLCALNLSDPVLPSAFDIAAAFFRDPTSMHLLYDYVTAKLRYLAFSNNCTCAPSSATCNTLYVGSGTFPSSSTFAGDYGFGTQIAMTQDAYLCGVWANIGRVERA